MRSARPPTSRRQQQPTPPQQQQDSRPRLQPRPSYSIDRKGDSTSASPPTSLPRADPHSKRGVEADRSRPWQLDRGKHAPAKTPSAQHREQKQPEKGRGFWNWRPFRSAPSPVPPAVSPPVRLRFHVLFSLHVHAIHGLPASMNSFRLTVHWKRKEEGIQTMPSRVLHGSVDFDEILRQRCTVFGVKNPHQIILYDAKLFTLSAVALDVNGLELGQHHVDLSRLLSEEDIDLPDAQHGSGWNTTFQLSGMAKGGYLSVTFNYDLLHHETLVGNDGNDDDDTLLHVNDNPVSAPQCLPPDSATIPNPSGTRQGKPPDLMTSGNPSEHVLNTRQEAHGQLEVEPRFSYPLKHTTQDESIPWGVHQHDDTVNDIQSSGVHEVEIKHITGVLVEPQKQPDISYPEDGVQPVINEDKSKYKTETDFEDEIELVAGEFLDMLDIGFGSSDLDSGGKPESPRERLLKQCESLLSVGSLEDSAEERREKDEFDLNFDAEEDQRLASIMEAAEVELQRAVQTAQSKSRAIALEDEETRSLMREWGLSEKTFQNSPPTSVSSSFQRPHLSFPPPIGDGLGPVLKFEDGGSLRSMNPDHFSKASINGGSLVMQTSKPVVVPSTMGSTAVDILRHLASFGTDILAKQAMAAMPLEDITAVLTNGATTLQQAQMDKKCYHHAQRSQASSFTGSHGDMEFERCGIESDITNNQLKQKSAGGYDDYVSLEDLAPLAMQNIEALAIDGLKVQADMADEDATSYLDAAAWGILGDKNAKDNISLSDGVAGVYLKPLESMDAVSAETKHISPLSMAITLEEWSKLDAGALDDGERTKERSLAILAAHNAQHRDCELTNREHGKRSHTRKGGIMGNTLMIAMLVQLRDPLRNFEPVGAPMMALIQAERVMLPPKPKIGRRVSVKGNNEVDDDNEEKSIVQKIDMPQFKLTGVHMSGLKSIEADEMEVDRDTDIQRKGWGNQKQVQSGSRWLLAQGMGKSSSKHSLLKSKGAPAAQTKVKPGETLWSISARVTGSGQKRRDLAALNHHKRNPDVIFTNEKIRTK